MKITIDIPQKCYQQAKAGFPLTGPMIKNVEKAIQKGDVVNEKIGYWVRWYEVKEYSWGTEHNPHCKCSECGREYDPHTSQFIKYCSNCGTRLLEKKKES